MLWGCQTSITQEQSTFFIDYEKYTLDNGLQVILHLDQSDPIVAIAITYHVGSSHEHPEKTGFAHLFEHLMFLDSENLGPGGIDRLSDKAGGSMNGSTNRDRTNYYQVVPRDALEKVLWAESDRMGYFINTVTQEAVDKEKQVVKNEKRQSVDNRPGGHIYSVIDSNIYPPNHPYHWQTIGSLKDLDSATIEDVRDFYQSWYGPNNATLVVAGDFDPNETKRWIRKYFDEIQPIVSLPERVIPPVILDQNKELFHEDKLASVPTLTMSWPTVQKYHEDSYPLEVLAMLIAEGKGSLLHSHIVSKDKLAPSVDAFNDSTELAGKFNIWVSAFAGIDLNHIRESINVALKRFELDWFTEKDLERVKAIHETEFYDGYNSISSILGKTFALAEYNIFAGSPSYLSEDIERILAVTSDDVKRVYERYIQNQPFVSTSFVPEGETDLAMIGSLRAEVLEEPIVTNLEENLVTKSPTRISKTVSSFDRSIEPPFGTPPQLTTPKIWIETLPNGIKIYGIQHSEVPMIHFTVRLNGGLLLDEPTKVGVANMVAEMMMEGTIGKTAEQLENAINSLGSSIQVTANRENLTLSGRTLKRNYQQTIALVREILLEPRWDQSNFDQAKQRIKNRLYQESTDPNAIASNVFNQLIYGPNEILGANVVGTLESIQAITIEDVKSYHQRNVSASVCSIHIVGDVSPRLAVESLSELAQDWNSRNVNIPNYHIPDQSINGQIFFVDVPRASQSVIRVGAMGLSETNPDFFPATIMNLRLGGTFLSHLNQVLREQKGYSYGASSRFSGSNNPGPFIIATRVRSNVTAESVNLINRILAEYGSKFTERDLEATQNYMIRSNVRGFETLRSKIRMLEKISALGFPFNYVIQREREVREMTLNRIKELAAEYLDPQKMVFLVVGDARTQLDRFTELGLEPPTLIDRNAQPINRLNGPLP